MESKQVLSKLNQARRALDALSQVEIIDEWEFDKELNVWHLHLGITIDYETKHFPQISKWYIVVTSDYPKGSIKVYPDVKDSIRFLKLLTMQTPVARCLLANPNEWPCRARR